MKKLVIAIVFVLCFMCGSVALADGAPSYAPEMYTVVVSNPNGAKYYYGHDYYVKGEPAGTYTYGQILNVEDVDWMEEDVLEVIDGYDWNLISTADVEIYGEPVTPQDLRFGKLWCK